MKAWLLRPVKNSVAYPALACISALVGVVAAYYSWFAVFYFAVAVVFYLQYRRPRMWGWALALSACVAFTVALGTTVVGDIAEQIRLPYSPYAIDKSTLVGFLIALGVTVWLFFEGPVSLAGSKGADRPA